MRKLTSDVLSISTSLSAILEIRDARLPRTCTHALFGKWRSVNRVHYLVLYTHEDAIAPEDKPRLVSWTADSMRIPPENVFIEDLRGHRTKPPSELRHVTSRLRELCLSDGVPSKGQTRKVLVAGVPNVGKSSFVYTVTKEMTKKKKKKQLYHAPNVRDYAGETQNIKSHWLFENPNIMLTDTPGLFPSAEQLEKDSESVYKLAVCGGLNLVDTATTPLGLKHREVADYLLYKLNAAEKYEYVKYYKMDGPTEAVDDVLARVQDINGNSEKEKCVSFIRAFNTGLIGELILDDIDTVDTAESSYQGPDEDDMYSTNLLRKTTRSGVLIENDDSVTSTTQLPAEPVKINDALGMAWPGQDAADVENINELLDAEFAAFERMGGPRLDVKVGGYRGGNVYGGRRSRREWRPPADEMPKHLRAPLKSSPPQSEQRTSNRMTNDPMPDQTREQRDIRVPFRRKRGPERFDEQRGRQQDRSPPDYQEGNGDFRRLRGQEAWQRNEREEPPNQRPSHDRMRRAPSSNRGDNEPMPNRSQGRQEGFDRRGESVYDAPRRRLDGPNRQYEDPWKRDAYVWNDNNIPSVRQDRIPRDSRRSRRPPPVSRSPGADGYGQGAERPSNRSEQQPFDAPRQRRRPPPPPVDELEYHFDDTDF